MRMGEAAETEEGVRECSGREGGRGEEGTEGCGVTHLSHLGWAWAGLGLAGGQLPALGCGNSSSLASR